MKDGIELGVFVKGTMVGLDKALKWASSETGETYLFTNGIRENEKGNIHFDLTVYSEKWENATWEWSIKVCWLWWGFFAWWNRKNTSTSNIKFSVARMK